MSSPSFNDLFENPETRNVALLGTAVIAIGAMWLLGGKSGGEKGEEEAEAEVPVVGSGGGVKSRGAGGGVAAQQHDAGAGAGGGAAAATKKKNKKKKSKKKSSSSKKAAVAAEEAAAAEPPKAKVSFSAEDDDDEEDDEEDMLGALARAQGKTVPEAAQVPAQSTSNKGGRSGAARKGPPSSGGGGAATKKSPTNGAATAASAAPPLVMEEPPLEPEPPKEEEPAAAAVEEQPAPAPAATGGEKKKRKRKKKKKAASSTEQENGASAAPASAPAASGGGGKGGGGFTDERWETIPVEEEWKSVSGRRSSTAAAVGAEETPATSAPPAEATTTPAPESNNASITLSAGPDPLILIGKGGATMRDLETTTGAQFELDRDSSQITVTGTESEVGHAVEEITRILDAEARRKLSEKTVTLAVGSDGVKAVIGKGGSTIQSIQSTVGPDVRIDADVDAGTIVLVGPEQSVAEAQTLCDHAIHGESQDVLELWNRNAVNVLYGRNFQTIRDLQDTTGCRLDVERGSTSVKLSGSKEAVSTARSAILQLLEDNRGSDIKIEATKVGAVYGKAGTTIRSIQDRTGVFVEIERGETHATCSVMGPPDAVREARRLIQKAVDGEVELKPGEVAASVELGSIATPAIIGRGGSKVMELERTHGVRIHVDSDAGSCKIVGTPDRVEEAKEAVEAIARPLRETEQAVKEADKAVEAGDSAWHNVGDDDADGW